MVHSPLWVKDAAEAGKHIRSSEAAFAQFYEKPDRWRAFSEFIISFDDERLSKQGTLELLSGLVLDYAVIPLPDAQTMLTFVNMSDSVRAERALKLRATNKIFSFRSQTWNEQPLLLYRKSRFLGDWIKRSPCIVSVCWTKVLSRQVKTQPALFAIP